MTEKKLRDVELSEVGDLLNQIYHDELHFRLGWVWDAGMDYSTRTFYDNKYHNQKVETGSCSITDVMTQVRDDLIKQGSSQDFTNWCNTKFGEADKGNVNDIINIKFGKIKKALSSGHEMNDILGEIQDIVEDKK